jgi:hypothetical protein
MSARKPLTSLGAAAVLLAGACTSAVGSSAAPATAAPIESTTSASVTTAPSDPTSTAEPTLEAPPIASLVIGGRSFKGTIGGYSWKTHGDAAPWLPATALDAIQVAAGASVSVKLNGAAVAGWTARMARASDTSGHDLTPLGEGHGLISFSGPRSGSWVISVAIQYTDDLGDGSYYWRLDVR